MQTEIGWDQVLFGRLGKQWDALAQYRPSGGSVASAGIWVQRTKKLSWQFGLDCWQVRNQMVHGTTGGVSTLERERVMDIIGRIFQHLIPVLPRKYKDYLNQTEEEICSLPYQSQVAWLGQVQFLLPDQYKEALTTEQGFYRDTNDFAMMRSSHLRCNIL